MTDRRSSRLFGRASVAAAATVAALFGQFPQPAEAGHTRGFTYTIGQGGAAPQGVIPLRGATAVETFYGYPGGAARSNTGLEQSDTSLLFLYEDPRGKVSLVMIHDANDGTGGRAVFNFASIPDGTTFVVRDDPGDGSYVINIPGGTARVTWRWDNVNTDGGALSGSLEQQAWTLTISPQFRQEGAETAGKITAWKFLTGSLTNPTEVALDMTEPIVIKAIPAGLQVVTNARLIAEAQNCRVGADNGQLATKLRIIVDGMLQISGEQIIATDGEGRTHITFEGEIPANRTLTFTVVVDGGTPQVVRAVPVQGHFSAEAIATPPVVKFTVGPVFELSGAGFAFKLGGATVFTGPWTLTAVDATLLKLMMSPDFPQIGWTAQIQASGAPALTFANVSGCDFTGTGQRNTIVRSGFVDIRPGMYPNSIGPDGRELVPVAILGSENFDVRVIDSATIEIDDDRLPGGGIAPTQIQKNFADVNGDGFLDLTVRFAPNALNQAGLLGNKRLFITGAVGSGEVQVFGSDTICLPANCVP